MPALSRRSFLASLASFVPLTVVVRHAHAAAFAYLETDPATLTALAETVLPATALGKAGVAKAAISFRDWGAGYRESAELVHGYGTSRLRSTGPTPLTRWSTQLDDLDSVARRDHQKRFSELSVAQRTAIVRAALQPAQGQQGPRLDRMPSIADASHVALALLAHFYDSPTATDLCYEAQIGRTTCRPLAASSRKPLPFLKVSER